jgi:hypothetical protein
MAAGAVNCFSAGLGFAADGVAMTLERHFGSRRENV